MGLRVRRYTPPLTKADAVAGLVGLMVVLARLNAATPATLKPRPTKAGASVAPTRQRNGTSSGATNEDTSHMKSARSSARAGGGTFNSSELTCLCTASR